jgi:flavin-dependent dehydrogenase
VRYEAAIVGGGPAGPAVAIELSLAGRQVVVFERREGPVDAGEVEAAVLVAADGLHSALRRAAGLERPVDGPRRFGVRRHIDMAPWAPTVEVHFGPGAEAYVTAAGPHRVGVAFLWVEAHHPFDSSPRGAGPMLQCVTGRIAPRFVLVGDVAGFVDAIEAGEGSVESLTPYDRAMERLFTPCARLARTLVFVAAHLFLRRLVVDRLIVRPALFEWALAQ